MSNFLALAAVTATLRSVLLDALGADLPGAVPGADVTTVRPDGSETGIPTRGVNLYLYQVSPNPTWRNVDLPSRRGDGQLVQRPQAALDLHYLLSFYGNEQQLEPQRLLGLTVQTLHARPALTRALIAAAIKAAVTADPTHFLAGSDLAETIEPVRLMPMVFSTEELSRLWSVFFQTPYALSVAYQASVVLLEGSEMPQSGLPVRERNLYVVPFRRPLIEQIQPQNGLGRPIVADSLLLLRGSNLRGDLTRVRIAGVEVTPQDVADDRIILPLATVPAAALRAGVQSAQAIYPMQMGTPPSEHRGVESNIAAFVLRPTIATIGIAAGVVNLTLSPTVGKSQRVVLLLNQLTESAPAAYSFVAPERDADGTALNMPISGVKTGTYLARVQIDGAESVLDLDNHKVTVA